jgi:hypothetical protein
VQREKVFREALTDDTLRQGVDCHYAWWDHNAYYLVGKVDITWRK